MVIVDQLFARPFAMVNVIDALESDSAGYQQIRNSAGLFVGTEVPGFATGTYQLSIAVDGTPHANLNIAIVGLAAAAHTGNVDRSGGFDFSVVASAANHEGTTDLTLGHDWSAANAKNFTINVDGGGVKTINLTTNCADQAAVLAAINAEFVTESIDSLVEAVAGVATGTIKIQHKTTGASHNFILAEGDGALAQLGMTAATYTGINATADQFSINVDGGGAKTINLTTNCADLDAIVTAINTEFSTESIDTLVEAVASGNFVKIQHKTAGAAYNFILAAGGGTALTTLGLTAATYTGTNAQTLATILATIQTALRTATSSTETVGLSSGKIRVTSALAGPTSAIAITAGASNDFLAALEALTGYNIVVEDAVAGIDGGFSFKISDVAPDTRDFIFIGQCMNSSGVEKTGMSFTYSKTTGRMTVADVSSNELEVGDVVTVIGVLGTIA